MGFEFSDKYGHLVQMTRPSIAPTAFCNAPLLYVPNSFRFQWMNSVSPRSVPVLHLPFERFLLFERRQHDFKNSHLASPFHLLPSQDSKNFFLFMYHVVTALPTPRFCFVISVCLLHFVYFCAPHVCIQTFHIILVPYLVCSLLSLVVKSPLSFENITAKFGLVSGRQNRNKTTKKLGCGGRETQKHRKN